MTNCPEFFPATPVFKIGIMKNPIRFLIVEDNQDDEFLLLRQLKKAQLDRHIRVIDDGGKALDYLKNERYKSETLVAIFLDLQLPTVSGIQLLEAIRADERIRHLPVILMSSSNAQEDLDRCRELGVSSYVRKPISFTAFAKAVADTFDARRSLGVPVVASGMVD
jgi:CheY-like chemotaxis protein